MKTCTVDDCGAAHCAKGLCKRHYLMFRRSGNFEAQRGLSYEEKFWRRVAPAGADECWLWPSTSGKYGNIAIPGSTKGAHRVSYEIHKGPIPEGMFVMHSCDTPKCVNPAHLSLGTPKENMDDMWRKGRAKPSGARGEAHRDAKLTPDDVRYIRGNPQISHADLARRYGIDPNSIIQCRQRRTWKHIQ